MQSQLRNHIMIYKKPDKNIYTNTNSQNGLSVYDAIYVSVRWGLTLSPHSVW